MPATIRTTWKGSPWPKQKLLRGFCGGNEHTSVLVNSNGNTQQATDQYFMGLAIEEAKKADLKEEVRLR